MNRSVLLTVAVLAIATVVAGPFGTHALLSLGQRLVYWPAVVGVSVLVGTFVRVLARRWLGHRGFFVKAPAIALAVALLLSPVIHLLTDLIIGHENEPLSWYELGFYVFMASLSISALREALAAQRTEAPLPTSVPEAPTLALEAASPSGSPRILARLEPAMRAPLVRLSVNDHYVEVVTEAGATNILLRFADALAEVEGVPGLRVHRSHWVADGAVRGARREGGRVILSLSDGVEVPVSRPNLAAVEARGWIS